MKIIHVTSDINGEIVHGLGDDGKLYSLWYRCVDPITRCHSAIPALEYQLGSKRETIVGYEWEQLGKLVTSV